MSYAKDSKATDEDKRTADFNHFVIFDPRVRVCYSFASPCLWCHVLGYSSQHETMVVPQPARHTI